ncbi:MAG TPA: hypothetical protein VG796_19910 [Verrucomicrobiales bacterium]|nr:hypothetical protein [Verrucomicrobiales bacterium]
MNDSDTIHALSLFPFDGHSVSSVQCNKLRLGRRETLSGLMEATARMRETIRAAREGLHIAQDELAEIMRVPFQGAAQTFQEPA